MVEKENIFKRIINGSSAASDKIMDGSADTLKYVAESRLNPLRECFNIPDDFNEVGSI